MSKSRQGYDCGLKWLDFGAKVDVHYLKKKLLEST